MTGLFGNIGDFIIAFVHQVQTLSPILAVGQAIIYFAMYSYGGQQAAQFAKQGGVKLVVGTAGIWLVATVINTLISLTGAGGTVDNISLFITWF